MPFNNTSFRVGDYEVSATFPRKHDPVILGNIQQILLASFAGNIKRPSCDTLAVTKEEHYTVGGGHHHAP